MKRSWCAGLGLLVAGGCGLLSATSSSSSARPVLKPVPAALAGSPVFVPPPAVRGPEARHALDVAAEVRDATMATLRNAGFVVVHAPEVTAAEVTLTLVVDYCFVDVARLETQVRVTRAGADLGSFTVPAEEMKTVDLPLATAIHVTNHLSTLDAIAATPAATPSTSSPAPRPAHVVAILDVQDPNDALDAQTRAQLTDYLTANAVQLHGWKSVPRAQLRQQLQQEKAASYETCVDDACQIELGKAVAAEKLLVPKLLRLGKACTMVLTLYDLRTEAAESAATVQVGCAPSALAAGIDDALKTLAQAGPRGANP